MLLWVLSGPSSSFQSASAECILKWLKEAETLQCNCAREQFELGCIYNKWRRSGNLSVNFRQFIRFSERSARPLMSSLTHQPPLLASAKHHLFMKCLRHSCIAASLLATLLHRCDDMPLIKRVHDVKCVFVPVPLLWCIIIGQHRRNCHMKLCVHSVQSHQAVNFHLQ